MDGGMEIPQHVAVSQSFPTGVQMEKLILTTMTIGDAEPCEQLDGFLLAGGRGAQPVMYNVLTISV